MPKIQSRNIDLAWARSCPRGPRGVQNMFMGQIWPTGVVNAGAKVSHMTLSRPNKPVVLSFLGSSLDRTDTPSFVCTHAFVWIRSTSDQKLGADLLLRV